VRPGSVGATLTLGDGQEIKLADQQIGKLAQTGGVQISKLANGQLLYEIQDQNNQENQINTLSTARGEVYQLRLPDGSRVWINSASSISYNTNLNNQQRGGQRIVRLSGEAYFEIAKDKKHPFVVKTTGQQVEVLGTHFNISAYPSDKFTHTTLVEGVVKVSNASESRLLKPNQQAELAGSGLKVTDINAAYEVGWKDGVFVFNYEPLEAVMTKISRWYDLKIVYVDSSVKEELFFGTVSKFEQLSKALNMLARTEVVRFEVEGKTVRVFKK
jgi:transmembrane sensor